jgi:anti-sigma-K factor RskA
MGADNNRQQAHDCDAILEIIPDYAFGLTDLEATRWVEAQMANCPEAAAQLADYRRLQAEMRASVAQIEPPPQLGERLMAAIAPLPVKRPALRRRLQPAWLIAAAAVIALLLTNLYWLTRATDLAQQRDALVAQARNQDTKAFVLTSTSGLRWVRLPPAEENAQASAFMMWNAESEIGLLYAHGFPKLVVGKTYQLWLTRGAERANAGTFRVDEDGKGALLFHISGPIDNFTWARITAEPENGSDQPTGTVVVNGEL